MKQHIVHMIRNRATKFGSREVFRFQEKDSSKVSSINWNQLIDYSNNISRALLQLNFGLNDKIGIFSDNKPEWTISDIGIMAIRAIPIPIYATSSVQQVKYIVDETEMRLMFVGKKEQAEKALWLLDNCKSLETIVVFDNETIADDIRFISWTDFCSLDKEYKYADKLENVLENAGENDIATIIYTSGTTGEPKGVILGHDNFMYCFNLHKLRIDIYESDVSLCFLPLSHIFERCWTFYILYCGAINFYIENPKEVAKILKIAKPNVMCTVPRFFEKTLEGIENEKNKWQSYKRKIFDWAISVGLKNNKYKCKSKRAPLILSIKLFIARKLVFNQLMQVFGGNIRFMPCSGAAIRPEVLKFFHATGLNIIMGYGATETTATVACFKDNDFEFESCGSIMPNVNVKISDDGEILVSGKTIFKGYYLKSEDSEKTIVNGWYKTGDKGYFSKEGSLVMTDRIKDLFKTSVGKYVSPQKVELLIGQDKYIEQVVVIGDNRKFVTALIVPAFESLRHRAEKFGFDNLSDEILISRKEIHDFIKERIDKIQQELSTFERIVKFTLLHEPFSIENKSLTNTLKIRRKIIIERYHEVIEKMYSGENIAKA